MVLLGLVLRGQLAPSEELAGAIGEDVVELDANEDREEIGLPRLVIGKIAVMAKTDTKVKKGENAERDALDVTFGLIGEEGDDHEQRNGQRTEGDKEAVPMIGRGKGQQEDSQSNT